MLGLSKEETSRLKELQREYNKRQSEILNIMEAQLSGLRSEWGGTARCFNSKGEIINMADDLNRREAEKN